jgi:hypothetical protein
MKTQDEKRSEAEERQAEHDGLNTMQKLGKLAGRPGESKLEKARLLDEVTA